MNLFNKLEQLILTSNEENIGLAQELAISQEFDLKNALEAKYGELIECWNSDNIFGNNDLYRTIYKIVHSVYLTSVNHGLTKMPDNINLMKNLESIGFQSNKISNIPKQLFDLEKLSILRMPYNKLTAIPKEIDQLKQLKTLELNNNELTTIPKNIAKLPNLKYLFLSNNPLTDIHDEIFEMENLKFLYIVNTAIPRKRIIQIINGMPQTNVIMKQTKYYPIN